MKANEAPEKLYVNFHFIETHPESHQPLVTKQGTNKYDIEYVRKDAFVEKACEWLKESITNNPECNRIISKKGVITMGELIEDFRKYMGK